MTSTGDHSGTCHAEVLAQRLAEQAARAKGRPPLAETIAALMGKQHARSPNEARVREIVREEIALCSAAILQVLAEVVAAQMRSERG